MIVVDTHETGAAIALVAPTAAVPSAAEFRALTLATTAIPAVTASILDSRPRLRTKLGGNGKRGIGYGEELGSGGRHHGERGVGICSDESIEPGGGVGSIGETAGIRSQDRIVGIDRWIEIVDP